MSATAGATNGNILELDDIHVYYGAIHALKGVSLVVREREIVTLIGANGAGKSTTLRAINGLNRAAAGRDPLRRATTSRRRRRTRSSSGGSRRARRAAGSSRG